MALIIPDNIEIKDNAEKSVYVALKNYLTDDAVCYYNYLIEGTEFDFCIIIPSKAIYIIEVKAWEAVEIVNVVDNNTIRYRDRNNEIKEWGSPHKQARNYRFKLEDRLKREFSKKPLIIEMVCYPNICSKDYFEKRLDIISERECTICKEDLMNSQVLITKLNEVLKQRYSDKYDTLDKSLIKNIRRLYESDETLEGEISINNENIIEGITAETNISKEKQYYSYLKYIKGNKSNVEARNEAQRLINMWKNGTRIYIASDSSEILIEIKKYLESSLGYLNNYNDFKLREKDTFKNMIFNFTFINVYEEIENEFEVINGTYNTKEQELLEFIDINGSFNFSQFKVEHAQVNKDICVTAGAGSGKTFSMISRITYLIYKHNYSFESIHQKIALITFTNEAADNMKKKLKSYFKHYYLLTGKYECFRMIDSIEGMNISTIHSLTKKVISKYSAKLGMGKDINIVNGVYERETVLKEVLNEYIEQKYKNKDVDKILQFSMYELSKRLTVFIEKLEQKNIDLRNIYSFGDAENKNINDLVKFVVPETQRRLLQKNDEENKIRLSNLIIKINELLNIMKEQEPSNMINIEYLFVDEFQDTDDIQINIMREFSKMYNFNFFVVGDIKQCIYRFRGAEVKAFDLLVGNESDQWESYNLYKNYRTDIKLLNKFHPIFNRMGLKNILPYKDDERLIGTRNINSINDVYFDFVDFISEADRLEKLVSCIKEENNRLSAKGKIAILVRKNSEVERVRDAFQKAGIQIETEGYGDLYQIRPTLDLYKLILALKYNRDPKYLFNLYSTAYTTENLNKIELFKIRKDKNQLYNYFINNCPIVDWNLHIESLKKEPIMKCIRKIIYLVKPWDNYAQKANDEEERRNRRSYYKRNIEQVIEMISTSFSSDYLTINKVEEFLSIMILTKRSEESRESFNIEKSTSPVICTTIHKSKGLEYEVVIMPFCDTDISGVRSKPPVDVILNKKEIGYSIAGNKRFNSIYSRINNNNYNEASKNENIYKMNEEARILYVAMTRAIRKFIWFKNTECKIDKCWQKLLEMR